MRYSKYRYKGRLAVPGDKRRACLCADLETYSRECCEGELINQGIGSLEGGGTSTITFVDGSEDVNNISGDGQDPEITPDPLFDCTTVTLTGFAVAQNGTVTAPTADLGTITATSPSSFAIVNTSTERTLTVTIQVPSGYQNAGESANCTTTATQSATPTFACSDIGATGFAVADDGTITDPTLTLGTIVSKSPTSFVANDTGSAISRTVTYTISPPAGYFNTGTDITCDLTVDQPAQPPRCETEPWYYFEVRNNSDDQILVGATGPIVDLSTSVNSDHTQVVVARSSSDITVTGSSSYTITQKGYAGIFLNRDESDGFETAVLACGTNINSSYFAHLGLTDLNWNHTAITDPNSSDYVYNASGLNGGELFEDFNPFSNVYAGGRSASLTAYYGVKFTCSGSPSHSLILDIVDYSNPRGLISSVAACT